MITRRAFLAAGSASVVAAALAGTLPSLAQDADTLTIAFNVNLPSFDPTSGASAVNPTIQAIYRTVFDQYIGQKPDLSFEPGILTEWGFNEDKTKVSMTVREGVLWHDGSPLTPEDVVWSIERAGDPANGNPVSSVWASIGNFTIDGNRIDGDVVAFDPTVFKWMAFLTGYVLPKAYFEEVGAEAFNQKPIGTGPYMVHAFESNAFLRLNANPDYWGPKPTFETVIFKFVTDATSRTAEIESGASDVTLEVSYEDYDRLRETEGLDGVAVPISDIGMIFLNNIGPMLDKNVRLAAHHAINKQAIIDRLLRGYGVAIDTLQAPEYEAYDASIKVGFDEAKAVELLAASGFSTDNPVRFPIQTTRGLKPKDYEMIQAIVGMWRRVGIEAEIQVYEIAQHYELRAADQLAPAAFYNWGDAIGDASASTGFAMFGPTPHSVWDTEDLDAMIAPLWTEKDEAARVAGWKAVDKYIAEEGYVIPLLQYVQPILFKSTLTVTPNTSGALQPSLIART
ncbi:peptide ABC transporter substrate-binding protein [Devosia rhizoryzae]|uniref:Peptide ABC transporter substrate-binding protein n=2 Tax=Devosia rhizoryzae TaxID=2774137 RepID=A0ABX7C9I6_9HYPH|nr:ABC transporter substrate-binding protein [Devosia rhizoryzae]QQR40761.1 peptide ABC transporter substrate-binding protein [Devosia rhizoryzae]